MHVHWCTWGCDCAGLGCSQESFPYVYVTSGVVTSVQKDQEGAGHVRGNQHAVINGAYYHNVAHRARLLVK